VCTCVVRSFACHPRTDGDGFEIGFEVGTALQGHFTLGEKNSNNKDVDNPPRA